MDTSASAEWKRSADGKTVQCGGKIYLPKKATNELGFDREALRILREGVLPNGEIANVMQELGTKDIFFSHDLIERLKTRFVYDDNGQSVGRCRVHNGPWHHGMSSFHSRSPQQLRSTSEILRYTHDEDYLSRFSGWLNTGVGPADVPVRKIRDTITGDMLLSFKTMHAIKDGLRAERAR